MYLHIGNSKNIRSSSIIGIFDTDNSTVSPITREFLRTNEKKGRVSSAVTEIPKSFVLYKDNNGEALICFSQISSAALSKRNDNPAEV